MPALLDPSEIVTIRGEDQKLSLALQAVLEKANSVTVAQVDVATWIPKSIDSQLYLQYLYTRARSTLKKIESDYNVVIHRQSGEGAFLELQGNVKQETEAAREALTSLLATHGQTLYMAHASIPQELHRYVIGKGGQNIVKLKSRAEFQGRLVDLILPNEDEDSDKILMIIQRMPYAGAKELKSSDEEAVLVIHEMATALIQDASQASDFTSLTLAVDSKYHGRLIGAGGAALKELLGPLVETSSVRFPHADSKSSEGKTSAVAKDSVLIKGPSKNVTEIVSKIQSLVSDWKKLDSLINFSETVKVEEGMLHKLFSLNEGLEGVLPMSSIGWVVRGVRDSIAANSKLMATMEKDKDNLYAGNYHLRLELPSSSQKDTVVVFGPKLAVPLATEVIKARAQKILDTATEVFSIFEAPEIAELVLADPTIMDRTLRRVIGKEGKNIKKLTDKYGVQLKFMRGNRDTNGLPSAEDANGDSTEDVSPTDDASPEKTPGLVKIKGIKSDVEDAKLELLSLVEHEVKRSNVLIFSIPIQVLPHVLGRGGSKSTKLKEEFDAYMDFEDDGEEARVTLEGSKENCIAVHKVILDIADGVVRCLCASSEFLLTV